MLGREEAVNVKRSALPKDEIQRIVQLALAEDVGDGDATTLATIPEDANSTARMIAREPMSIAGLALEPLLR